LGARGLDTLTPSDFWIAVYIGKKRIGRTAPKPDDNSPVFIESFEVGNYNDEWITFIVYEHDPTKDDYLGEVHIKSPKSGKYQIEKKLGNKTYKTSAQLEVFFD